jgi:hypothetical protein
LGVSTSVLVVWGIFNNANLLRHGSFDAFTGKLVMPLHRRALQNATISNIKNDNCKALQNYAKNNSFVTDSALHAQLCTPLSGNTAPHTCQKMREKRHSTKCTVQLI